MYIYCMCKLIVHFKHVDDGMSVMMLFPVDREDTRRD